MSMYYELLDESLKEKEPEIIDLDEGKVGKTAAAAATAAALATGAMMDHKTDQVKNIPDTPNDVLVVPDYKDMPNLWGDVEKVKPQKVSVAKPAAKVAAKAETKTEAKPTVKATTKKAEPKKEVKPNNIVKHVANSADVFKDAAGNTWDMENAYKFLISTEDFRSKAYRDGKVTINGRRVPRYSIGYGTLAPNNSSKATITEPEARKAKINHIKKHVLPLIKKKGMKFDNQGQFTSTVSYVYNVGHLPPMLKNGKVDWENALNTNVFNGKKNRGLMDRRKAEMYNALIGD